MTDDGSLDDFMSETPARNVLKQIEALEALLAAQREEIQRILAREREKDAWIEELLLRIAATKEEFGMVRAE